MDAAAGKNNFRSKIVITYCPTVSASAGGAYSQKPEALKMMKIQNYPRTHFWIDINTKIEKWMDKREQIILMGD